MPGRLVLRSTIDNALRGRPVWQRETIIGTWRLQLTTIHQCRRGNRHARLMEHMVEEKCEDNATKVIHAAKKGLTAELFRLLRKDEMTCIAAHDKLNYFSAQYFYYII